MFLPITRSWIQIAKMPLAVDCTCTVGLPWGELMVIGGHRKGEEQEYPVSQKLLVVNIVVLFSLYVIISQHIHMLLIIWWWLGPAFDSCMKFERLKYHIKCQTSTMHCSDTFNHHTGVISFNVVRLSPNTSMASVTV